MSLETEVSQRQAEILQRVLSLGLLSAQSQRERGYEPLHSKTSTSHVISGCLIRPVPSWQMVKLALLPESETTDSVKMALYDDAWSVFPVIAERGHVDSSAVLEFPDEELEKRFFNSALAIISVAREDDLVITEENWFVDTYGKKKVVDRKFGLESPVSVNQIETVLIPARLGGLLSELPSTSVSLVPVGQREESLFRRYRNRRLQVPDYETEIKRRLSLHRRSLFIHGIRLPINSDVIRG